MTEHELNICTEAYKQYKTLSAAYLMRKLKCNKDHALELVDEFLDKQSEKPMGKEFVIKGSSDYVAIDIKPSKECDEYRKNARVQINLHDAKTR